MRQILRPLFPPRGFPVVGTRNGIIPVIGDGQRTTIHVLASTRQVRDFAATLDDLDRPRMLDELEGWDLPEDSATPPLAIDNFAGLWIGMVLAELEHVGVHCIY